MHAEGDRGHTGSLVVNLAPQPSYVCDLGQLIQLLRASVSSLYNGKTTVYLELNGDTCIVPIQQSAWDIVSIQ